MGKFTIGPPPPRTGDERKDLDRIYNWCEKVAVFLEHSNNTREVRANEN